MLRLRPAPRGIELTRRRTRTPLRSRLLTLLAIGAVLAACRPSATTMGSGPSWRPADLRLLDPPEAATPDLDLIALYTRLRDGELQIRLDLLEMQPTPAFDLFLALDTSPGGQHTLPLEAEAGLEWDVLLVFPAEGGPRAYRPGMQPRSDLLPRLVRDPGMGTVEISLNTRPLALSGAPVSLQAFLTPPGSPTPLDHLGPVRTDRIESARATVVMAFWHVFPAYTPAQAVRRWDGAHTGPYGERHGLENLLRMSSRHKVPLILADAKNPASLSALDFLGQLPTLHAAAASGRVALPDTLPVSQRLASGEYPFRIPEPLLLEAIRRGRAIAQTFQLPASQILYSPWPLTGPPPEYRLVISHAAATQRTAGPAVGQLARWEHASLLELAPAGTEPQLTKHGFPLEVRRALMDLALDPRSTDSLGVSPLMLLGGDLTASAWGDPQAAEAGFAYLANHPWIRLVNAAELLAANPALPGSPAPALQIQDFTPFISAGIPLPGGRTAQDWSAELYAALADLPAGPLRDQVLEGAMALVAPNPPESPGLPALQASQFSQVGWLLAAAEWASAPGDRSDCSTDPDLDGLPECILASDRLFAVIEAPTAELKLLFSLVDGQAYQWIGPSAQFVVGLSDPGQWDLSLGPAADPAAFQGALRVQGPGPLDFTPRPLAGGLDFTTADGGLTQRYLFTPNGLRISYTARPPQALASEIPLIVPSAMRFAPGWADRVQVARRPAGISWGLAGGPALEIRAQAISLHTFLDSRGSLSFPEDPNQNFTAGHFLPFPFAVAQASGFGELVVELVVQRQ